MIGDALREKRKHRRIAFGRMVNIRTDDGRSMQLEVLDYSMGGMGLISKEPFAPGDRVHLDSILTLDGEERRLELRGQVVHVQEQYEEFAFGVTFR
jgi:hypothetical protein